MARNRYSGVNSTPLFLLPIKRKLSPGCRSLLRTIMTISSRNWCWHIFMPGQVLIPERGDRRSFIKTVVNTKALMLVRDAERQKRWTGARTVHPCP